MASASDDWLTGPHPRPMLWAVERRNARTPRSATPDRKLRLFAAACCRRVWDRLPADGREAVVGVERLADREPGAAEPIDYDEFRLRSAEALSDDRRLAKVVGPVAGLADAKSAAHLASMWAARLTGFADDQTEFAAQADLLRCVVGNPWRPVRCRPAWRTPTVVAIAAGVYADRAFDRLPVLADALEDAGCDAADLLAHLRGPGPHARGCWPVDLILGKS